MTLVKKKMIRVLKRSTHVHSDSCNIHVYIKRYLMASELSSLWSLTFSRWSSLTPMSIYNARTGAKDSFRSQDSFTTIAILKSVWDTRIKPAIRFFAIVRVVKFFLRNPILSIWSAMLENNAALEFFVSCHSHHLRAENITHMAVYTPRLFLGYSIVLALFQISESVAASLPLYFLDFIKLCSSGGKITSPYSMRPWSSNRETSQFWTTSAKVLQNTLQKLLLVEHP